MKQVWNQADANRRPRRMIYMSAPRSNQLLRSRRGTWLYTGLSNNNVRNHAQNNVPEQYCARTTLARGILFSDHQTVYSPASVWHRHDDFVNTDTGDGFRPEIHVITLLSFSPLILQIFDQSSHFSTEQFYLRKATYRLYC